MGKKSGAILGSILGLYTDFLFSQTIGISLILMGLIGWSGDCIEKKFSKESKLTIVIMSVVVTTIYEILNYIFKIIKLSANIDITQFLYMLIIEIVYNALIVIIFYPLLSERQFILPLGTVGQKGENIMKNKEILPKYF